MIVELPLKTDKDGNPRCTVTIINPKNKKSIKVDILPDTGANTTFLDAKYGRTLGVEGGTAESTIGVQGGTKGSLATNLVNLDIKVGALKPINTPVSILTGKANFEVAIMGTKTFLLFKRVTFTGTNKIRFEDDTPVTPAQKQAAYVHSYIDYHYGGIPRWNRKRI